MNFSDFPSASIQQPEELSVSVGISTDENDGDDSSQLVVDRIRVCRCLRDFYQRLQDEFRIDRAIEHMLCRLRIEDANSFSLMSEHHQTTGIFRLVGVENIYRKLSNGCCAQLELLIATLARRK